MDRREFLFGLLALGAGCNASRPGLTVGCKNFPEQLVLGEMLAQSITDAMHIAVERRFYLGGSYIAHQALLAGRIDTYVEYTGTALSAILKLPPPADHSSVFNIVREEYRRRFHFEVLPSLGFNNSFAVVMRPGDASRVGAASLSDLAHAAPHLKLGVGYEFLDRIDGLPGLVRTYGLRFAAAPQVMDLALLYRALQSKQVDVIVGSNTDGLIEALGLIVLQDDKGYFPPYDAVPIARTESLNAFPPLRQILTRLTGHISVAQMRRLNFAVEGEKRDAAQVVHDFLASSSGGTPQQGHAASQIDLPRKVQKR